MKLTVTQSDLLKIIHDTKAVSVWNHKAGPVFWYAANVPGPFYVNTELVIGSDLAEKLLGKITAIVAATTDLAERAEQLNQLILTAYRGAPTYQKIIAAMVDKAKKDFPSGCYSFISGGERRDWLFSIPVAEELGIRHAFLFKNHQIYCKQSLSAGETALHVADLINNAASFFDAWFPILEKAGLKCAGAVCVNSRGTNGVRRLQDHGQTISVLNSIDITFFEKSCKEGLIDRATLDEIALYFKSPQEWVGKYLLGHPAVFDVPNIDKKSFERLQIFLTKDPWSLRDSYEATFTAMEAAVAKRLKAQSTTLAHETQ